MIHFRLTSALVLAAGLGAQDFGTRHDALGRDFSQLESQGHSLSDAQLITRLSAYGSGFQGLVPMLGGLTPGHYQSNRDLVRRSLAWLALIEPRGYRNPALGRAIAGVYGTLGDFGSRAEFRPYGYPAGAAYGYAGAGRLCRRMWLGGGDDGGYERDFERYATNLAVLGGVWGYGFGGRTYRKPEGLDAVDFGPVTETTRKPLAVPAVDLAKLSPAQKEQWGDLKPQFSSVAGRVHEALVNLDALAQRLKRQGMDVNATDRANSVLMESFLQDSADLIQAGDFEQAKKALDKASYVRMRLKSVVGG